MDEASTMTPKRLVIGHDLMFDRSFPIARAGMFGIEDGTRINTRISIACNMFLNLWPITYPGQYDKPNSRKRHDNQ